MKKMVTLQDLIDFAKKNDLDPEKCFILKREVCANDDVMNDYFDEMHVERNIEVLNENDEFEKVEQGISILQLWIPDMFGN